MTHIIFIYGTLKKGFHNAGLLEKARYLDQGITQEAGYGLRAIGSRSDPSYFCPGLTHGKFRIAGEVYDVNNTQLALLDQLESVDEGRYARIPITIITDSTNQVTQAETYLHQDENEIIAPDCPQIKTRNGVQYWALPLIP